MDMLTSIIPGQGTGLSRNLYFILILSMKKKYKDFLLITIPMSEIENEHKIALGLNVRLLVITRGQYTPHLSFMTFSLYLT